MPTERQLHGWMLVTPAAGPHNTSLAPTLHEPTMTRAWGMHAFVHSQRAVPPPLPLHFSAVAPAVVAARNMSGRSMGDSSHWSPTNHLQNLFALPRAYLVLGMGAIRPNLILAATKSLLMRFCVVCSFVFLIPLNHSCSIYLVHLTTALIRAAAKHPCLSVLFNLSRSVSLSHGCIAAQQLFWR